MNSAYNRVKALKCFFGGIEIQIPGFKSPFRDMEQRLIKKMGRTKKVKKQRALTAGDAKRLLRYLEGDESLLGKCNYASIFSLLYTGLRASELCNLRWKDIEYDEDEGVCFCNGIGKGDKPFHQEIGHPDCIQACLKAFTAQFKREPKQDEYIFWTVPTRPGEIFWTVPTRPGEKVRPLNPHALWYRLTKIGEQIRAAGVITKDYTWSPHLMRRSAGTLLDKKGVSLVAIQNFLRHEDVSTTAKHYVDNQELVGARLAEMLN
jgi:integrase